MFTQCSKCETVFKLSAEVLRAAGGQVRCGKCGEVFNALAHLAEDASAFSAGESELDLEVRANRILETPIEPRRPQPERPEDFVAPGVEIARLQILDWSEDQSSGERAAEPEDPQGEAEISMEFTLPPGELDRIFVEPRIPESQKRAPRQAQPIAQGPEPQPATGRRATPQRAEAQAAMAQRAPAQSATAQSEAASFPEASQPAAPIAHPEEVERRQTAGAAAGGFEVSEDVRREMLAGMENSVPSLPPASPSRQGSFVLWLSAALAAAALLIAQIVHQNREWLASHGPFGPVLRDLYSKMGAPVPQPADLSAYQLRQWGVTGDPAADGTLRVRASILNTTAQLEPFPLLRVTLANRFGGSIGSRDFEPSEYMGRPIARLLAPGERVDATMDILDPGKNAEGFEIDVCLRGLNRKISCANDVAAAQAKR